ncbi:MAG: hypothetical protein ACI30B_00080, partial [Paludibacteraceae bacterium]
QAPLGNKTNTSSVRFVLYPENSPVENVSYCEKPKINDTILKDVLFFFTPNYFGIKIGHTPPFFHDNLLKK